MMFRKLIKLIDDKLIRHFRESYAPVHKIALASTIGLFWALTPLIGIQMTLVTITWFFFRLFRIRFVLPVAIAWTWITNPVTMAMFYYFFYSTGVLFFTIIGYNIQTITFASFNETLILAQDMSIFSGLIFWTKFILNKLGWPMLVGSFVIGIPVSLVIYPITRHLVNKFRIKQAKKQNLTLTEWENIYLSP